MSYISKKGRAFCNPEACPTPHEVRSEGRLKRYSSSHDPRNWCYTVEDRRKHILELLLYGRHCKASSLLSIEDILRLFTKGYLDNLRRLTCVATQLVNLLEGIPLDDWQRKNLDKLKGVVEFIVNPQPGQKPLEPCGSAGDSLDTQGEEEGIKPEDGKPGRGAGGKTKGKGPGKGKSGQGLGDEGDDLDKERKGKGGLDKDKKSGVGKGPGKGKGGKGSGKDKDGKGLPEDEDEDSLRGVIEGDGLPGDKDGKGLRGAKGGRGLPGDKDGKGSRGKKDGRDKTGNGSDEDEDEDLKGSSRGRDAGKGKGKGGTDYDKDGEDGDLDEDDTGDNLEGSKKGKSGIKGRSAGYPGKSKGGDESEEDEEGLDDEGKGRRDKDKDKKSRDRGKKGMGEECDKTTCEYLQDTSDDEYRSTKSAFSSYVSSRTSSPARVTTRIDADAECTDIQVISKSRDKIVTKIYKGRDGKGGPGKRMGTKKGSPIDGDEDDLGDDDTELLGGRKGAKGGPGKRTGTKKGTPVDGDEDDFGGDDIDSLGGIKGTKGGKVGDGKDGKPSGKGGKMAKGGDGYDDDDNDDADDQSPGGKRGAKGNKSPGAKKGPRSARGGDYDDDGEPGKKSKRGKGDDDNDGDDDVDQSPEGKKGPEGAKKGARAAKGDGKSGKKSKGGKGDDDDNDYDDNDVDKSSETLDPNDDKYLCKIGPAFYCSHVNKGGRSKSSPGTNKDDGNGKNAGGTRNKSRQRRGNTVSPSTYKGNNKKEKESSPKKKTKPMDDVENTDTDYSEMESMYAPRSPGKSASARNAKKNKIHLKVARKTTSMRDNLSSDASKSSTLSTPEKQKIPPLEQTPYWNINQYDLCGSECLNKIKSREDAGIDTLLDNGDMSTEQLVQKQLELLRSCCDKLQLVEEHKRCTALPTPITTQLTQIRTRVGSIEKLNQDSEMLTEKVKNLERELEQYRSLPSQLTDYQNKCDLLCRVSEERDNLLNEVDRLKAANKDLRELEKNAERTKELELQLLDLAKRENQELVNTKASLESCRADITRLQKENEELQVNLINRDKELDKVDLLQKQNELNEMEKRALEIKIIEMSKVQEEHEELLDKLDNLEEIKNERDLYKEKCEELVKFEMQNELMQAQLDAAKKMGLERDELAENLSSMQAQIIDKDNEITYLKCELEKMESEYKQEIERLKIEIEKLRSQLELSSGDSDKNSILPKIQLLEKDLQETKACLEEKTNQVKCLQTLVKSGNDPSLMMEMKKELEMAQNENKKLQEIATKMVSITGDEHVQQMLKQSEYAVKKVVEELGKQYQHWDCSKIRGRKRSHSSVACTSSAKPRQNRSASQEKEKALMSHLFKFKEKWNDVGKSKSKHCHVYLKRELEEIMEQKIKLEKRLRAEMHKRVSLEEKMKSRSNSMHCIC